MDRPDYLAALKQCFDYASHKRYTTRFESAHELLSGAELTTGERTAAADYLNTQLLSYVRRSRSKVKDSYLDKVGEIYSGIQSQLSAIQIQPDRVRTSLADAVRAGQKGYRLSTIELSTDGYKADYQTNSRKTGTKNVMLAPVAYDGSKIIDLTDVVEIPSIRSHGVDISDLVVTGAPKIESSDPVYQSIAASQRDGSAPKQGLWNRIWYGSNAYDVKTPKKSLWQRAAAATMAAVIAGAITIAPGCGKQDNKYTAKIDPARIEELQKKKTESMVPQSSVKLPTKFSWNQSSLIKPKYSEVLKQSPIDYKGLNVAGKQWFGVNYDRKSMTPTLAKDYPNSTQMVAVGYFKDGTKVVPKVIKLGQKLAKHPKAIAVGSDLMIKDGKVYGTSLGSYKPAKKAKTLPPAVIYTYPAAPVMDQLPPWSAPRIPVAEDQPSQQTPTLETVLEGFGGNDARINR
jgi:hypothetical protein